MAVNRSGTLPIVRFVAPCCQTVVPLSQERAVPIELVAALDVQARVEGLLELMADPSLEATVLCGHGGQIAGLLRLLCDEAASGDQLRRQKGSTWVLDQDGGDLRAVRYLPPLGSGEPGDQPGDPAELGLVNDRRRVHARSLPPRWCHLPGHEGSRPVRKRS